MTFLAQQSTFSAGKFSAHAAGREDLEKYGQGFKDSLNVRIGSLGGTYRRGGTRHIAAVKTGNTIVRVVKFKFSADDQYVLEIGNVYIRFYRNQAQIGAPYQVTTPYLAADVMDLRFAQSGDTVYVVHKDYAPRKLVRTGHTSWAISTISFTAAPVAWGANDYPQRVWIHESRLYFGNSPSYPNTFWASRIDDYEDMTTGSLATDGFSFTLVAEGQPNGIQWVVSNNVFAIGTAGAEFVVYPPDEKSAISVENIKAKRYTSIGSHATPAVSVDAAALFVQKGRRKLRQFQYVFENDRFESTDISLLSGDLLESGIEEIDFLNDPENTVFMRRTDGKIACMTYEPTIGMNAMYLYGIAGTDAVVESICTIDGSIAEEKDELWMVVSRTINGATRRYIEVLDWGLLDEDEDEEAFFFDSGITVVNGTPSTAVSGLSHLEGETVSIFADGAPQADKVVSSGAITLDVAATTVNVGLDFSSYFEMLPARVPSNAGSTRSMMKRPVGVFARVHRSLGMKAGADADSMREYIHGPPDNFDTPYSPFTGLLELDFDSDSSYDVPIRIESSSGRPLAVLSLFSTIEIGG
jgi:hypothetical protein